MGTQNLNFHHTLVLARDQALKGAQKVFQEKAIEAHVFGSVGRYDSDPYSDLDIWFTFKDEIMEDVRINRFEHYAMIGEVVHVCEPPQNVPINGVHSHVLYRTFAGLLQIDIYLCPQSTSFLIKGSRKLFGNIDLPESELSYNPQKAVVDETYRIDNVIIYTFMAIKNMVRGNGLKGLFQVYDDLPKRFGIATDPLADKEHTFDALIQVVANLKKVSNNRQKKTLLEIENFVNKVRVFLELDKS